MPESQPSSDREPVVIRRPWGSMEITEHGEGEDRYYETTIRKRDYDPGELAERVGMDGGEAT